MRYGNKSVISKIEDDDKMPFTKDGRRVDLLLNLLAIVNRTTSFPMYELIATSIAYKVRNRLSEMDSYDDREKLLFDIIYMYNEKQYDKMKALNFPVKRVEVYETPNNYAAYEE